MEQMHPHPSCPPLSPSGASRTLACTRMLLTKEEPLYFNIACRDLTEIFVSFLYRSCLILYQNIVPISLYISIEIVKTAQAYFIHKDIDMYDERVDQACTPKTWNISDDLGQIEYIFSDKTGTLTQNVMEFQKCTINGIDYGIGETDATRGQKMSGDGEFEPMEFESDEAYLIKLNQERLKMKSAMDQLFDNKYYSDKTTFVDSDIFLDMADPTSKHAKAIMNFWTGIAVCHTVLSERGDTDPFKIEYKAQSPDEAALVSTARDVGFVFLEKKGAMIHLEIMGQPRAYKVLNILEFNSNRKRMSIILRPPEGGIVLVCKGADSVIYERLDKAEEQSKLREDTLVDLERFANEGMAADNCWCYGAPFYLVFFILISNINENVHCRYRSPNSLSGLPKDQRRRVCGMVVGIRGSLQHDP